MALHFGEFGIVQLLSSYGASRTTFAANRLETAATIATRLGHHDIAAWLRATRNWTPLHHLEFLTRERTRAMLRDGADIHAEVKPFGVTPLSIAQDLEAAARPVIHRAFLHGFDEILAPGIHNALLILEAAKPWSRKTHTLFPAPARARRRSDARWPVAQAPSERLPDPVRAVGDVRDAARGHARLQAAASAAATAAAPERADRGAHQDAASHARGIQAGGALPRSGSRVTRTLHGGERAARTA